MLSFPVDNFKINIRTANITKKNIQYVYENTIGNLQK